MTPMPTVGSFAQDLYDSLLPLAWDDENQGWALLHLCEAIGRMFQPVEDIARDTDEGIGWSQAMDPDRAPSWILGWLAQFGGVTLQAGLDDAEQRDQIKSRDASKRGRPATIIAEAQQFLTGAQHVFLDERDTSPYHFTVVTRTGETPDPAALLKRMRDKSVKPAGVGVDVSTVVGETWDEEAGTWNASATTWDT